MMTSKFVNCPLVLVSALLATVACSNDEDPFAESGGEETTGGSAETGSSMSTSTTDTDPTDPTDATETTDPTMGTETGAGCEPLPSRMIVLGDSIAACSLVCIGANCQDDPGCSYKIFNGYVNDTYSPVTYENLSVPGEEIDGLLAGQLSAVETGMPGHALVVIFIGGNDLRDHVNDTEEQLNAFYAMFEPFLRESWDTIFAFFDDPANFPDGATVIMNNQYNPYDHCTAPPFNITQDKWDMLEEYNGVLAEIAGAHDNGVITNTFDPFMGHGFYHNTPSCPFYMEGADRWTTVDIIHPNAIGHSQLSMMYANIADNLYGGC